MTLSQMLQWRGLYHQTTYKDISAIDGDPLVFYFGVDPSANSMTIGNLAAAMLVRHFIDAGHKAVLLVGGATGMIGDPDGKKSARDLKPLAEIAHNKSAIVAQYKKLFAGKEIEVVDNYDWFKNMNYLTFLRDVGKHVPVSQMLGREFVQSRLGDKGSGINYAEFSYALIQGYDFLHLFKEHNASLQLCGADQWGNCIAGVDLIRRSTGKEAHIYSMPLIINQSTGVKFGKSEEGAVWLDPELTSVTQFYQFWINLDDNGVEDYLKIYTLFSQQEIEDIMLQHNQNKSLRYAQTKLACFVTELVHGKEVRVTAESVTNVLTGKQSLRDASSETLTELRNNIPDITVKLDDLISDSLVQTKLASSLSDARRLLQANAISINGDKINHTNFKTSDFVDHKALLRKGKAYKDTVLIELVVD